MRGPDGVDFAGQAPLSGNSPWIAAEPGLQPREEGEEESAGSSGYGVGESGGSKGSGGSKESSGLGVGGSEGGSGGSIGGGETGGSGKGGSGQGGGSVEKHSEAYVSQKGKHLGGIRTVPLRSVEAGPFVMEVWVEEGQGKAEAVREVERERELERELRGGQEGG